MIEVIVDEHRSGEAIVAALEELVLAHRVVPLSGDAELPDGMTLPAIREGGRIVSGGADVAAYLLELEAFAAEWSKFQSDTCHFDSDGTDC
jgi:hypothetical protein